MPTPKGIDAWMAYLPVDAVWIQPSLLSETNKIVSPLINGLSVVNSLPERASKSLYSLVLSLAIILTGISFTSNVLLTGLIS